MTEKDISDIEPINYIEEYEVKEGFFQKLNRASKETFGRLIEESTDNDGKKHRTVNRKVSKFSKSLLSYVFLTIIALFILVPFYVIIITAFKTSKEATTLPFTWWPKNGLSFQGFYNVLFNDMSGGGGGASSLLVGLKNTLIITIPSSVVGLLTSAFAAYAFSKIRFKGRNVMFGLLLGTMMIPGIIMLVPSYMIYDRLHLTDTFFPLIVPGMFGSATCVFFLRQFFMGIPDDLIEAAKMDGMGHLGIFFKIIVPLAKPALLSQFILGFVGGYNDYFGPLLYLQSPKNYTLQIALKLSMGTYNSDWQTIMSGCVLTLIPTLIIFIIAQKYFVKGIAMTGIK